MLGFSFFHRPKPRQFDYRPRYFDPEAEEREQRKKELLGENYADAYKKEEENKAYDPSEHLRETIRLRRGLTADRRAKGEARRKARTRRTLILVVLLAFLVWYIFFF